MSVTELAPPVLDLLRSQWMGGAGKELYTEYFRFLVANTPVKPVEKVERCVFPHTAAPANMLVGIATEATDRLMRTDLQQRHDTPFVGREAEILHYTAVSEFNMNMDSPPQHEDSDEIIRRHSKDSIQFGQAIAVGTAFEVIDTVGSESMVKANTMKDREGLFAAVSMVLRCESFETTLDQLATTGFALVGGDGAPTLKQPFHGMSSLKARFGLPTHSRIIHADRLAETPEDFRAINITLSPEFRMLLARALAAQNDEVAHDLFQSNDRISKSNLVIRFAGQKGFTRGCPLARGPTFGILRNYLADIIDATSAFLQAKEQDF